MFRNWTSAIVLPLSVLLSWGCNEDPGDVTFDSAALPDARRTMDTGGWVSAPLPTPAECQAGGGPEWTPHAARQTTTFEHDLGRVPQELVVYVAFNGNGCGGILASGDMARIQGADAERVILENGTQEDFFMRIALR